AAIGPFSLGLPASAMDGLAEAVAGAVDLAALLPCDPELTDAAEQQACFDAFVPTFAHAAWRRPLVDGDLDAQATAFAGGGDFGTRMRAVITTVLAAPDFYELARTGTPTDGDAALVVLDAHALATRLAMFLWNSGPDAELLALADSGELLDAAVLRAQAERLLADARAARMVDDFHAQWLGIADIATVEKDATVFPEFDAALAGDMLRGTQLFARSVVLGGSGRLEDLFTQPSSFANAALAAIYGDDIVGAVPEGAAFEAVALDPTRRGGLLTEPSVATANSLSDQLGFTPRGLLVRANLLCEAIPPPPDGIDLTVVTGPGISRHESWLQTVGEPSCMGCHAATDPLGFALDNYDAIGRWTDEIDGEPVEPSSDASDFPYEDRAGMLEQLLASEELTSCVVQQYARYALDRELEQDDACTQGELEQALIDADGNVRVLALAIVDADAFRVARLP
ncbi:MAG: DUF1592 domain-containing protein, partial [Deltaproteobacteria bacterium]|nr:DUF1592 domain-containing protein [Nannocystaceae bacterium]